MMKRAGIVIMGLLLPFGQVWSAEGAATSGWQVTPFFRLQLVHRLREERRGAAGAALGIA